MLLALTSDMVTGEIARTATTVFINMHLCKNYKWIIKEEKRPIYHPEKSAQASIMHAQRSQLAFR